MGWPTEFGPVWRPPPSSAEQLEEDAARVRRLAGLITNEEQLQVLLAQVRGGPAMRREVRQLLKPLLSFPLADEEE